LLAVAHEHAALADQLDGRNHARALIRPLGQKAADEIDRQLDERCRLFPYQLTKNRRGTHRFPVENADVTAELVGRYQGRS
jgi:hypothetical protein